MVEVVGRAHHHGVLHGRSDRLPIVRENLRDTVPVGDLCRALSIAPAGCREPRLGIAGQARQVLEFRLPARANDTDRDRLLRA